MTTSTISTTTSTQSTSSVTTTTPYVTTTTPDKIETTTELNLDEICEGVFFGARPHPTSTSLFIACIRGTGTVMACLNGQHFDPNLLECTLRPEVCEVPEDLCEGINLGVVINPCYCYRYFVCYVGKISIDAECEMGLIFDARNEQ